MSNTVNQLDLNVCALLKFISVRNPLCIDIKTWGFGEVIRIIRIDEIRALVEEG